MADPIQKTFDAIRAVLIGDETLTDLVSADRITPANASPPPRFPCINIRIEGGENYDFPGSVRGRVYIHAYHQGSEPFTTLNEVQYRIYQLLHHQETSISDASVDIKVIVRSFLSPLIPETEMAESTWSTVAYYEYMSQPK